MEGSWRVRGGFVEGSWRVHGGFMEGSSKVPGAHDGSSALSDAASSVLARLEAHLSWVGEVEGMNSSACHPEQVCFVLERPSAYREVLLRESRRVVAW